jgi:hypothetical protein
MNNTIQSHRVLPPSAQIKYACACLARRPKHILWHLRGIGRAIPALLLGFVTISH